MTTFEEISSCEKANREFFTSYARLSLIEWRQTQCPLALRGFRKNMKHRRDKKYFEGENNA